jgi:prepilin-type processing-associated H-X9-DG protein
LADANHWGGSASSYLIMAPHGKSGPCNASGSTWRWGTGTETPDSIGGAGGNVGYLDGSVAWLKLGQMKRRYASSYVMYYGNW